MNSGTDRRAKGTLPRVLVVDDEEAIRRNFKVCLEDMSYHVVLAEDGDRAMELVQRERFDVVLTDLRMAQMGGLKLIGKMRQVCPDTPIIVVSGSGGVEDVVAAIRLGAWDYVTKPVHDPMELHNAIQRALERFHLAEESRCRQERLEEQVSLRTRELQAAMQFTDQIISSAAEGIVVYDRQLRCMVWNPSMERLTGMRAGQVLGKCVLDLFPHLKAHSVDRLLERALSGETVSSIDVPYFVHHAGTSGWISATYAPNRDVEGNVTGVIGVVRDTSTRKRAELDLKSSEEKFSKLFKTSPAILFIWSITKTCFIDVNEAFERATGYARDEVIGRSAAELGLCYHPADAEKIVKLLHNQSRLQNIEQRLRTRAGGTIDCLMSAGLIELSGESCALFAASDITDLKRLENQILRMQREESIGRLVNGVAHDLNNILSPILTAADLLKVNEGNSKNQRYLNVIRSSTLRAADLVKQLSLYSRGVEGVRTEVDPGRVIQDIVRVIRETFPKSIDIRQLLPARLQSISGDETQIHQVVMNLCVNARDAMPNGGVIEIEAENVTLDESFTAKNPQARPGTYVLVKIADTGSGIPPEVLPKIFDPFFTTKPVGQGTGLGLSTVLGIVRSHGGFVDVQSRVDAGSVFLIYLPARELIGPDAAQESLFKEQKGSGEVILVVEDEEVLRNLMRDVLETSNYRVICARNGAEALNVYATRKTEIELVIMDMWMPVMDGATAIRQLQTMNPELRVIAVSGVPRSEIKAEESSSAIKAFLHKPVETRELLSSIATVVKDGH